MYASYSVVRSVSVYKHLILFLIHNVLCVAVHCTVGNLCVTGNCTVACIATLTCYT
jgi:hypothetical protein